MRNYLFISLALVGACKWTDFDDLEDTTWVRSTEDPDLGSTDYAVAIAGVSQGTSGGTLAVVSDDTANFSTISYNAKGGDSIGANPIKLGMDMIGAIAEAPAFVTDPTGRIGLVERSISPGNYAVVFGSATAPVATEFAASVATAPAPDAALFVPNGGANDFVFAAGGHLYRLPAMGGTPSGCELGLDVMTSMPINVAALEQDGTNVVAWTKSGALISYPVAAVAGCDGNPLPAPTTIVASTSTMPAPGARVHLAGDFAILTGHPMSTRSGTVTVVRVSDGTIVGSAMTVEGLRTSILTAFGTDEYLVLGVPDRAVSGVAAGEVDVIPFNRTTGALDASATVSLHDADPESGQLFGRTVTTMSFNGNPILVVGADSEVFAYYRTSLYDQLP